MRPGYRINVITRWGLPRPLKKTIVRIAGRTLRLEGAPKGALNLLFTDDAGITGLNRRFLGRRGPTDVIAFGADGEAGLIGEIAISVERARYNAGRFSTTFNKEVSLYVIHGILHLLGYDDANRRLRAVMEKRQLQILDKICR